MDRTFRDKTVLITTCGKAVMDIFEKFITLVPITVDLKKVCNHLTFGIRF